MNRGFHRCKRGFSQTYLLGSFVRRAPRSSKVRFRLPKERAYSLWRPQSVSGLLSQICNSSLPSALGALARVRLPRLSPGRFVFGPRDVHRDGFGSDREHSMPGPQWPDPAAAGAERFSPPRHAADLLAAFPRRLAGQPASRARQTSRCPLSATGRAVQRHRGCRQISVRARGHAGRGREAQEQAGAGGRAGQGGQTIRCRHSFDA